MAKTVHGATWGAGTSMGPILSEGQARRIEDILGRARGAGAELVTGGSRAETAWGGIYFQPTILSTEDVTNPAVLEEFFGPVLTVQTFDSDDEGIEMANHPTYGLAGGVHTHNIDRAIRAARGIQAGAIWVNDYGAAGDPNMPFFAPHKQSGLGQEGGVSGMSKYMKTKVVRILTHGG
jgi:aldehyde dehydrogenase (NAD+)